MKIIDGDDARDLTPEEVARMHFDGSIPAVGGHPGDDCALCAGLLVHRHDGTPAVAEPDLADFVDVEESVEALPEIDLDELERLTAPDTKSEG